MRREVESLRKTATYLAQQQLLELRDMIDQVLEEKDEAIRDAEHAEKAKTIVAQRYVQEPMRCGKANCKCARGELHGPYWVLVKTFGDGRTKKQYVGKQLPAGARAGHVPIASKKTSRSARRSKPRAA